MRTGMSEPATDSKRTAWPPRWWCWGSVLRVEAEGRLGAGSLETWSVMAAISRMGETGALMRLSSPADSSAATKSRVVSYIEGIMAEWEPGDWKGYFDAVAGLPAREDLVFALGKFEKEEELNAEAAESAERRRGGEEEASGGGPAPPSALSAFKSRLAVDLGCGDGRCAVEMLRQGWRVVAVDSEPEGIARLVGRVPEEARA